MDDWYVSIRVIMMPKDANPLPAVLRPGVTPNHPHLSIFGGVILSYIDQAGAIGARREVHLTGGGQAFLVTVAINRVEFRQPVLVGDVVSFLTKLVRLGRTSITMQVRVEAERDGQTLHVTEAEIVYAAHRPQHAGAAADPAFATNQPLLAGLCQRRKL